MLSLSWSYKDFWVGSEAAVFKELLWNVRRIRMVPGVPDKAAVEKVTGIWGDGIAML